MNRTLFALCVALSLFATSHPVARGAEEAQADGGASTWVTSIAKLDQGNFVAATADGLLLREAAVVKFPADNPAALETLYTHPAAVWRVVATDDGSKIASVDYRGNLVVYDTAGSQPQLHEKALERWCQAMVLTPEQSGVIAGNEAGKVMVWDFGQGKVTTSVELDGHAVTGLAISPEKSLVAASDGGGHVHLLKWPSLESVGKINVSEQTAWCVCFVDGGQQLLVGSSDRNLYRCDAAADAKAEVVTTGSDWITQLAVSPSGQIAAAEVGGKLHFPSLGGTDSMEAKSGVWSLCWNGDGQLLAGTRKDGIVMAGRSWKWTEAKLAAEKPADAKPAEEKPAEDKPAEDKPAEDKPAEDKPAEDKPAEDKPAEDKPAEDKPAEDKPAEDKPADAPAESENSDE